MNLDGKDDDVATGLGTTQRKEQAVTDDLVPFDPATFFDKWPTHVLDDIFCSAAALLHARGVPVENLIESIRAGAAAADKTCEALVQEGNAVAVSPVERKEP